MEIERTLADKFIRYLKKHGYPEESIVYEWKTGNVLVDIAILDIETRMPIALFELKSRNLIQQNKKMLEIQLQRYLENREELSAPFYLVYEADNRNGFVVQKVEKRGEEIIYVDSEVLDGGIMQNTFDSKWVKKKLDKKDKKIDSLEITSLVLGVGVAVILVLDMMGIIQMTTNRLILLGLIIGLILFRFLQSFKILGIEAERKGKRK